jgi:excisionase family DNA binding protein
MEITQNNVKLNGHVRKQEMAKIMGVSIRTIETWMARRIIPYHKIGKVVTFNPEQVKQAIDLKFTINHL